MASQSTRPPRLKVDKDKQCYLTYKHLYVGPAILQKIFGKPPDYAQFKYGVDLRYEGRRVWLRFLRFPRTDEILRATPLYMLVNPQEGHPRLELAGRVHRLLKLPDAFKRYYRPTVVSNYATFKVTVKRAKPQYPTLKHGESLTLRFPDIIRY